MKKVINYLLIAIVIIAFSKVLYKTYQYYTDKREYSKIQELQPIIKNNRDENLLNSEAEDEEKSDDNEKVLLDINNDYKFWLSITNSNINYPVVQGTDNDFYLNHNFNKEKSISGTLFIDYENNIASDKNIIIYGHHMKNNTMFNNLNYFKNEDFFYNNEITVIKNEEEHKYEAFSVYVIPENEISFDTNISNDNEYINYFNTIINKSFFYKDIDFNTSKKIITLVTCSYEYDGARTVVHAITK